VYGGGAEEKRREEKIHGVVKRIERLAKSQKRGQEGETAPLMKTPNKTKKRKDNEQTVDRNCKVAKMGAIIWGQTFVRFTEDLTIKKRGGAPCRRYQKAVGPIEGKRLRRQNERAQLSGNN